MHSERILAIHFNDGTRRSFSFPPQTDGHGLTKKMKQMLEQRHLTLEVDGVLMHIPLSSVKYVEVTPAPEVLSDNVLKGASVVS